MGLFKAQLAHLISGNVVAGDGVVVFGEAVQRIAGVESTLPVIKAACLAA